MADDDLEEQEPEYAASLRVWSETLSVTDISSRLGKPSASHQRGDVSTDLPEFGLLARHPESLWLRESGLDQHIRLAEHIEALVAFAESHRSDIDAIRDACDIDITCSIFQYNAITCGFWLEPELSRRLGQIGLLLKINSY